MLVRGLGPLSECSLNRAGSVLTVIGPQGTTRLSLLTERGGLHSIVLVRVPYWPLAWLGWGPAWVCDLRFDDADGKALRTMPAGGGWVETARRATRYGLWYGPEQRPRLVPGWAKTDVAALVSGTPIGVGADVVLRRRLTDRILLPGWSGDPQWLASVGP